MQFVRTGSSNIHFLQLVKALDAELTLRDGEEHAFYDQFNKLDAIRYVIVAMLGNEPVGCGAIKTFSPGVMEVKRMYILPLYRGRGVAKQLLRSLETWATSLGCNKCILETGIHLSEAIGLYQKSGYLVIPNYGQYAGVPKSICFEKILSG